jgi:hypothetical protein
MANGTIEVKRDTGVVVTIPTPEVKAPALPGVETKVLTKDDLVKEYGKNRYSSVMIEFHQDMIELFGVSDAQALRAAKTLGSDLGRGVVKSIKIGERTKKDDFITVKDVGGYKGQTTYSIALCKACALLKQAKAYGITVTGKDGVTIQPVYLDFLNDKPETAVLGSEEKK